MLEDHDVIYDFDDLFDSKLFENDGMGEEALVRLLDDGSKDLQNHYSDPSDHPDQQPPQKKKRGPHPKTMTREQFYKIRPKMPKISKTDPRRLYAQDFVEAYNSCDFDKILEFVEEHSADNAVFIHRWVGQEQYLNFPHYLEVKGLENIAEYWFSRCVIVPDLVAELKETKLYVRSDGFSTVLSSFIVYCTRMYDSEVSEELIVKPFLEHDLPEMNPNNNNHNNSFLETVPESSASSHMSEESNPEIRQERVMEKLDQILLHCEPVKPPKRRTSNSLKRKSPAMDDGNEVKIKLEVTDSDNGGKTSPESSESGHKKMLPRGVSLTLLGTVQMQLNKEQKVTKYEITFALKK